MDSKVAHGSDNLIQVGIDASKLEREPIVLEQDGRPVGTVISPQEFRAWQDWKQHSANLPSPQPTATLPTPPLISSEKGQVTDALRVQILGIEHSSLQATRGLGWNEVFARAGMFLTLLSAAIVSIALVAQATDFGFEFRRFALLLLPVVFFVGLLTYNRLNHANIVDVGLLAGMNRLRHAYLKIAPDLEAYFMTGHHDDAPGVLQSLGVDAKNNAIQLLSGTAELVGIIDAVVGGVLAALIADTLGTTEIATLLIGVGAALLVVVLLAIRTTREFARVVRENPPRFPR